MSEEEIAEDASFFVNSSLNLLIKIISSLVVLLSVLIISLWAVYQTADVTFGGCLLYTSPSPRDATLSRMPSSA